MEDTINIFEYTDPLRFLKDFYQWKKLQNSAYSYQIIANKGGFKNKGYVYNLFKGKRAISQENARKLSIGMEILGIKGEYFLALVNFSKARNLDEKNETFEKLNEIYARGVAKEPVLLRRQQFEFYSNWRHLVIRSLIDMFPFSGDYKSLAALVQPPISVPEAKNSIRLLEKLNLIQKNEVGVYSLTETNFTTGASVLSLAVQNFHLDCTELARKALLNISSSERNMTGLTLGISSQAYEEICQETQAFQSKIINIVNADKGSNRVYQFNFHLFPLSKPIGAEPK